MEPGRRGLVKSRTCRSHTASIRVSMHAGPSELPMVNQFVHFGMHVELPRRVPTWRGFDVARPELLTNAPPWTGRSHAAIVARAGPSAFTQANIDGPRFADRSPGKGGGEMVAERSVTRSGSNRLAETDESLHSLLRFLQDVVGRTPAALLTEQHHGGSSELEQ